MTYISNNCNHLSTQLYPDPYGEHLDLYGWVCNKPYRIPLFVCVLCNTFIRGSWAENNVTFNNKTRPSETGIEEMLGWCDDI